MHERPTTKRYDGTHFCNFFSLRKEKFSATFLLNYGLWVPLQGEYHH